MSVRSKAIDLVDSILEQSVQYLSSRGAQTANGYDHVDNEESVPVNEIHKESFFEHPPTLHVNIADYMHSDSENFAITCDLSNGAEFMKSPTIESISGKSFDDNMSPEDEPDLIGMELHRPTDREFPPLSEQFNDKVSGNFDSTACQLELQGVSEGETARQLQSDFSQMSWDESQSATTIQAHIPDNEQQGD